MTTVYNVTVNSVTSHSTGKGVIYEMKSRKNNFVAGFDYLNIFFRRHKVSLDSSIPPSTDVNRPQALQSVVDNNYLSYSQMLYGIGPDTWTDGNPLEGFLVVSNTPDWRNLISGSIPQQYEPMWDNIKQYFAMWIMGACNCTISNCIGYCACGTSLAGGSAQQEDSCVVLPDVVLILPLGFGDSWAGDLEIKSSNGITLSFKEDRKVPVYAGECPPIPPMRMVNSNYSSITINGDELYFFQPTAINLENINGCFILSNNITDFKNLLYVTVNEESRDGTMDKPFYGVDGYGELKNLHHAVLSNSLPMAIGNGNSYISVYDSPKSVIDNFNYEIDLFAVDNVHIKNNCEFVNVGVIDGYYGIQNVVVNNNTKRVSVETQNVKNLEISLPYNTITYNTPDILSGMQGVTHIEKNSRGEIKEFCLADLIQ